MKTEKEIRTRLAELQNPEYQKDAAMERMLIPGEIASLYWVLEEELIK